MDSAEQAHDEDRDALLSEAVKCVRALLDAAISKDMPPLKRLEAKVLASDFLQKIGEETF